VRVIDTGILLAAVDRANALHEPARRSLEAAIADDRPVGIPWVVAAGFIRIATRRGAFTHPLDLETALARLDEWLAEPGVAIVAESPDHHRLFTGLLRATGAGGNLTTDAWIAAIAIGHGASVLSLDSDFARFPGLTWENPLNAPG
jgi:uncharacterized protein